MTSTSTQDATSAPPLHWVWLVYQRSLTRHEVAAIRAHQPTWVAANAPAHELGIENHLVPANTENGWSGFVLALLRAPSPASAQQLATDTVTAVTAELGGTDDLRLHRAMVA